MRKLSLLRTMLVIGLVIGLVGSIAVIGAGAQNSDNVNLTRTNGGLTLNVTNGASDVSGFDPAENYGPSASNAFPSTELEVFSTLNGNTTWTLSVNSVSVSSSPDGASASTIKSTFDYTVDTSNLAGDLSTGANDKTVSGDNGSSTMTYDYIWNQLSGDALADVPSGSYTIQVTYTVSA